MTPLRPTLLPSIFVATMGLVGLMACGPDVEARTQEFLDDTDPLRPNVVGEPCDTPADCQQGLICSEDECANCTADEDCGNGNICNETTGQCQGNSELADISGMHHLALSTVVNYDTPLQFLVTVAVTDLTEDGAMAHFEFQPLSLNMGSLTEPREEIGDPIILDTPITASGTFEADMGVVMAPGEANPITGGDITATIVMQGRIKSTDLWCGIVTGEVMAPVMNDLNPSFFSAIRVPDDAVAPDDMPLEFVFRCPEDEPDAGG